MTKKFLLLCVLAITVIGTKAQVVPTLGFINYFGDDPLISSVSSGIDGGSRIYTAGRAYFSTSDIVIQCTDSSGLVLWTYPYDNGGYDSPMKIRIDAAGNSYIVGESEDPMSGKKDFVLIVLDSTGTAVFPPVRYDHGFNDDDIPTDVAIDANGDIYVTGKVKNGSGNWNAVTKKYLANGSAGWQDVFTGSGFNDIGVCLVLANNQTDVIVAGTTENGTNADIVVYQLSAASGNVSGWVRTIGGTANTNDNVKGMILSGGNVVLTGMVNNTGTGQDYTTAKINASNGSLVFQKDYDFSSTDIATSLVRDSTGNIGITGIVYNSGTSLYEYHTLLYDSLGNFKCTPHKKEIGCSTLNVEPQIACDTIAHHFYVVGEIHRASRDILVYQLTPGGNLGWEKAIDRPASNNTDVATSVVVNGLGVLFIAGTTVDMLSGNYDMTTLKISQTPVYFPPDYGSPEVNDPHFVFQENRGQLLRPNGSPVGKDTVCYYNQGTSPSYYFNAHTISHMYYDRDTVPDSLVRVDLRIINPNPYAEVFHYEPVEARKNYFITSAQGITDVTSYKRLFIPEILPNTDVHHYSNLSGLKSYYVFKTLGESISALRFEVDGAETTYIDADGNLIATTDLGNINMGMLTAYQAVFNPMNPASPVLTPVTASWVNLSGNIYGFSVSGYAPFWPVVVYVSKPGGASPSAPPNKNLYWSTFIGNQGNDILLNSKTDAKGNYYTVGYTTAGTYPLNTGAIITPLPVSPSTVYYGIVSKFDNKGTLKFSSFVGGLNAATGGVNNVVHDIAIDSLYQIYLVGYTNSTGMPTKFTSSFPTLNYSSNSATGPGSWGENAFLTKLNTVGNNMLMSSYFGSTIQERFTCVKYWNGQIHIGGWSSSSGILLYASQHPSGYMIPAGRGLYMHLDTAILVKHCTKIQNRVDDLDMDNNGNAYLISSVSSSGNVIPIWGPSGSFYTSTAPGNLDWALQRFGQNDSLTWSTYIGGTQNDTPQAICIQDTVLAICGVGNSMDFPIVMTLSDSGDVAPVDASDIQLIKFNTKTGQMLWSAYHSSPANNLSKAIALDKNYNLYISGTSNGSGSIRPISTSNYYQQNTDIGNDGFIVAYNSQNQRKWTTYFGSLSSSNTSSHSDIIQAISITKDDRMFICGQTLVKNNSVPLVQWNNSCYFDWMLADTAAASGNGDGLIAMFKIPNLSPVGIHENSLVSRKDGLSLYPNPNNGRFNLRFENSPNGAVTVNVINAMGQIVYISEKSKTEKNQLEVDLTGLDKGFYLITVNDNKVLSSLKFVIE